MQRVVDEVIATVEGEFTDVINRRKEATKEIIERDALIYKDFINLIESVQHQIAHKCREEVKFSYRPVSINTEKRTSYTTFSLEQGEVNYAAFNVIEFKVEIGENYVIVDDAKYGAEAFRQAYADVVNIATVALSPKVVRADFGLTNDPMLIMARRQRGGR